MEPISREEVADIAWLAGVIDGEGTMHLAEASRNRQYIQISVCNTHPGLIQKITRIWERQNVKFTIGLLKRPPRRDYLQVTCMGLGSAKKVLESILPYLTAKYDQAMCLLNYIAWRQEQGYNHIGAPIREMGEKVRAEMHGLRYRDFDLQRLSRTASKTLILE